MRDVPALRPVYVRLTTRPAATEDWRDRAACVDVDPELFFDLTDDTVSQDAAQACWERCSVRLTCLAQAMDEERTRSGRYGYRGGYTPAARAELAEDATYVPPGALPGARTTKPHLEAVLSDPLAPGEWKHLRTVKTLVAEGVREAEIAEEIGVSVKTLRQRLADSGSEELIAALSVKIRGGERSRRRLDDLADAVERGQTWDELGMRYGMAVASVRRVLRRAGRLDLVERLDHRRGVGREHKAAS